MDFMIIIIMLMALYLAFGIGSNDETMSSVVGSGTLSLNRAVLWGGFLSCIGCIIFADKVGKNIGANLLSPDLLEVYDIWMILAIILGTSTWLIYASRSGAPISTTHSVVGSVLGVAFMWSFIPGNDFLYALNWTKLGTVALGWVISPILGLLSASIMQKLVQAFISRKWKRDGKIGFLEIEDLERKFKYLVLFFISITQLSRGGNDSANAIGIYSGLIVSGEISVSLAFFLKILIGLMMALGLILIGRNVIKNVGGSLIEMRPSDAFAIESANA
ncbi:MAG: inorganic phosphate transporter, partial [Promethearchaeota archaeon]